MNANSEKCINPWFGFLFIILVCVMIAAAILYDSSGRRRAQRVLHKTEPMKPGAQVNFPNTGKLIF